MRKTPEQVLTEWAEQEFTLDLGTGTHTYPVTEFYRLCIALALDGNKGLEPVLNKEFTFKVHRRAYATAWGRLTSVILSRLDDKQAPVLMRRIFDSYKIMWLSNLVDFEEYFDQVIFEAFGIRDGMRLSGYATIMQERINRLCLSIFRSPQFEPFTTFSIPQVNHRYPSINFADIVHVQPMTQLIGLDSTIK